MLLKKTISMILIVIMLASLLAACTPPVPSGSTPPGATEPTTESTTPIQPAEPTSPTTPTQPTEPVPTEPTELVTVHCILEAWVWKKKNDLTQHSVFTYSENGYLMNRKSKTEGQYKTEEFYRYDADGNLVYGPISVGGTFKPVTYTYDEHGRLISESYKDYQQIKYIYSYDDVGNLIYEEHWFNGELSRQITKEYNDAEQKIYEEWDYVSENGTDIFLYWVYDSYGNLLSKTTYYNDQYRGAETYTYDENGRNKTYKRVWDGYTQCDYTYHYDEEGELVRQESYVQSAIPENNTLYYSETTYKYDEWGNIIEERTTSEGGAVSTIRWTYDAQGNMLSRDYGSTLDEWTYDQWGNVLSQSHYFMGELSWEVTYSYTSFRVSAERVEQIRQQQMQYYGGPGYLD